MRKVLLLASLSMVLALVLAAPATAQSASASAPSGEPLAAGEECPAGTQPFSPSGEEDDIQCITNEQLGDYLRAIGEGGATRPATASPTASPAASRAATATAEPSATASATASASAEALPATGGPVSVLALGSLALLAVSGLVAFGLVRRG